MAIIERSPELSRIQPDPGPDPDEVVGVFQSSGPLPMRLEQSLMHLLELAVLAGELSAAQRAARVDDDVALLHRQSDLRRD